jgi:hypothetical protein
MPKPGLDANGAVVYASGETIPCAVRSDRSSVPFDGVGVLSRIGSLHGKRIATTVTVFNPHQGLGIFTRVDVAKLPDT